MTTHTQQGCEPENKPPVEGPARFLQWKNCWFCCCYCCQDSCFALLISHTDSAAILIFLGPSLLKSLLSSRSPVPPIWFLNKDFRVSCLTIYELVRECEPWLTSCSLLISPIISPRPIPWISVLISLPNTFTPSPLTGTLVDQLAAKLVSQAQSS